MKKIFALIIFTFFAAFIFSQNAERIASLEKDLRFFKSGEEHWGVKKEKAYLLLSIDKYNNTAISYLLKSFQQENQQDSINSFFYNLIANNKGEVAPYLIRDKYGYYADLNYSQRINNLKRAYLVDSTDLNVNYRLGELYYTIFNKEYNGGGEQSNLNNYAENSVKYFVNLCNLDNRYRETLKYPIIQLSNYLKDTVNVRLYELYNMNPFYLPASAFIDSSWSTDYSINVITDIIENVNKYSSYLFRLEELVLSDTSHLEVFRFTYLRTFDYPIVVRLENDHDTITIHWKIFDGKGGYDFGDVMEDKSQRLTLKEWQSIINEINAVNFWELPTDKSHSGIDGSTWILEGVKQGRYKIVDRWNGGEISSVCKKLLKMTKLQIKDMY